MANMIWTYAKGNWDSIDGRGKLQEKRELKSAELDQEAQDKLEELCVKFMEVGIWPGIPNYAKIAKSVVNYLEGHGHGETTWKVPSVRGTILKRYPDIK